MAGEIQKALEGFIEIMAMMDDQIEKFMDQRNETQPELFGDRLDRDPCVSFAVGDRRTDIDFAARRPG